MVIACNDGGTRSPGAVDDAAATAAAIQACEVRLQMDRYALVEVAPSSAVVPVEVEAACLASF